MSIATVKYQLIFLIVLPWFHIHCSLLAIGLVVTVVIAIVRIIVITVHNFRLHKYSSSCSSCSDECYLNYYIYTYPLRDCRSEVRPGTAALTVSLASPPWTGWLSNQLGMISTMGCYDIIWLWYIMIINNAIYPDISYLLMMIYFNNPTLWYIMIINNPICNNPIKSHLKLLYLYSGKSGIIYAVCTVIKWYVWSWNLIYGIIMIEWSANKLLLLFMG